MQTIACTMLDLGGTGGAAVAQSRIACVENGIAHLLVKWRDQLVSLRIGRVSLPIDRIDSLVESLTQDVAPRCGQHRFVESALAAILHRSGRAIDAQAVPDTLPLELGPGAIGRPSLRLTHLGCSLMRNGQ